MQPSMPAEITESEARRYEHWYATPRGQRAHRAEAALLARLLGGFPEPRRVLDVGCGTGHFTRLLAGRGGSVVGLDRSAAMLREARRRDPSTPLVRGDALQLPLPSRAVDLVVLITVLEFAVSPLQALREGARVAGRGIVVLAFNRFSIGGLSRRWGPRARGHWLGRARDVTPCGLRRMLMDAAGPRLRALRSGSVLLPRPLDPRILRLPLGDVIGVAAELR